MFPGGNKQCLFKHFPYLQGNLSMALLWASGRSRAEKWKGPGGGSHAMTLVVKPHPTWWTPAQDIPSVLQGWLLRPSGHNEGLWSEQWGQGSAEAFPVGCKRSGGWRRAQGI